MSSSRQHSGEGMPSSALNSQDEASFNAQFMDQSFDSGQDYLQNFRGSGEFNFPQVEVKQEGFDINRSPSPQTFGGNSFVPHAEFDFPLYGSQEQPQHINPGLYDLPQNSVIDPSALMPHHSPALSSQTIQNTHQGLATLNSGGLDCTSWEGIMGNPSFQTHQPAASDRSDISSATTSPLFRNQDFAGHSSPLIRSAGDFIPNEQSFGLDLSTISLSESAHHSPVHSPRVQPMSGQASGPNSPYLLAEDLQYRFSGPQHNMIMQTPHAPLPQETIQELRNRQAAAHAANAEQMQYQGPKIHVEFAPPQRQPTFPGKPGFGVDQTALSPPAKSLQRRKRSLSDPYAVGSSSPTGKPLSAHRHERRNSLTPSDIPSGVSTPCSVSSAASTGSKHHRRVSAPPISELERDKMLGLAKGPGHTGNPSGESSKRLQKHPATFKCTLCPKRFTRAYNLRSHLRTHTDERPFVCTICGKAFARQHDRKRHEGLHSGEKKFVCRGQLKAGGAWGCGRRFARADALGRHFRSEAGRMCIRPLLEEENAERSRAAAEQQQQQQQHAQQFLMRSIPPQNPLMIPHPGGGVMVGGQGGVILPAALLQQYPALATMDWDTGEGGGGGGLSGAEGSGMSSFEASAEEYEDDDAWDEGGGGSDVGSHRSSFDMGERPVVGSGGDGTGGWVSDSGTGGHWR